MRSIAGGLLISALLLIPAAASLAPTAPAAAVSPAAAAHWEKSVRPLLLSRCVECHGSEKQLGGLRLDSREALLKGGSRGPAILIAQPERSLLLKAVRHEDGLAMPPGGRLRQSEVADLEAWVRAGAPWIERKAYGADDGREKHWSFQPAGRPRIPAVRDQAWVRTPVDAFILSKLEERGLRPAPPADRRTLLRRATFDLTGLPPTPGEVTAFVTDPAPDAWEKVIDRLLLSPHYGEKWGRHWLDVARYADSNGLDENVHYANAWRYRDWVVRSVNRDLPWDSFIHQQLAGDLMPPAGEATAQHDQLIATGFLMIGPKMISEVDTMKMELDTIDEQLDTTGRAFMGLTLGCARCHDHKFDPISQADYYGMAGVFRSTNFMVKQQKPRMWFEHSLATEPDLARQKQHEAAVAAAEKAVKDEEARLRTVWQEKHPGGKPPAKWEADLPAEELTLLAGLREKQKSLAASPPEMPAAMGVADEEKPADMHLLVRGDYEQKGDLIPRRTPVILARAGQPEFDDKTSGRLKLARWITTPGHPLTGRVLVNRFWRWHFGRGIVGTPDNFGLLGEKPSHPELLDWMANAFTSPRAGDDPFSNEWGMGWSLKRFHRLVMMSNAYRMSSRHDERSAAVDPENRLLWRAPVTRLTGEELRDSMLTVSRLIEPGIGGPPLPFKNREYLFDHMSQDIVKYDSRRRTLYMPVVRNHLYDLLQLFDGSDGLISQGDRPTTTVAPQALFLMNSDLVLDSAEGLARRILASGSADDSSRLRRLTQLTWGRDPTPREEQVARRLLTRVQSAGELQAWSSLCHVYLQSNEFITLR